MYSITICKYVNIDETINEDIILQIRDISQDNIKNLPCPPSMLFIDKAVTAKLEVSTCI